MVKPRLDRAAHAEPEPRLRLVLPGSPCICGRK
jgi:hypothetical protein